MVIMWEADDTGSGRVDYGTSPFNLNLSQPSTSQTGSGSSRIHTAQLSSLASGQKYYYKISMAGGQTSNLYSFVTTRSPELEYPTQLIAISDMQRDGSHPNKFQEIIESGIVPIIYDEIGASLNDLEGILIPGDLVPTGGSYFQWKDYFFNPAESLFPYVPIYPVPGNHEYFGGGLPNFIKYFTLPDNAPIGLEDQCWFKDISNVRVIGLNSNSAAADQSTQIEWLSQVLASACSNQDIDFVFTQLHHPFKSELWTPGENDFTGRVIDSLEQFTSQCNKPSIHFFGHTHGYSRGQSRDHKHLWINVATAGGAIDNWGEFPNADYEEFVKSQDEYGFVLIDVEAGPEAQFTIRRYSRGDQDTIIDNQVRDELIIYKINYPPEQPINIYPQQGDTILSSCILLKASEFNGIPDSIQAAHWQIAQNANFTDSIVISKWLQNENFYFEENLQAGDDLTDASFSGLPLNELLSWRVRYRDQHLNWSPWSTPTTFYVTNSVDTISGNLIQNRGAESGTTNWIGDIESLENAECNSVSPFAGAHNFAVGGVCANEMNVGLAYQDIDLSLFINSITTGQARARFGGYLRNFNGSDLPEVYVEFYQGQNLITTTNNISSNQSMWLLSETEVDVPTNTDNCRLYLKGTRNAGSDNDSYFDELMFQLVDNVCSDCFGDSNVDQDQDGFCDDLDCDDFNNSIYPGALELCDSLDNNCDGLADFGEVVTWTGAGTSQLWGESANWDQQMVPLACQFVVIGASALVIVDGVHACKGIVSHNSSQIEILPQAYLNVDSRKDNSIVPAFIEGLLEVNGRWEVR